MNWLFESPTIPLFFGALILAVFTAIWVQTRDGRALLGCAAVAFFTASWLAIQYFVVTEVEQIKNTIRSIATLAETGDVEGIVGYISESKPELAEEVRSAFELAEVEKVSIKRNLQATVSEQRGYLSGEARFNAVATIKSRRGGWESRPVPRFFIVQLRKEDNQWRVRSYEARDPREGL